MLGYKLFIPNVVKLITKKFKYSKTIFKFNKSNENLENEEVNVEYLDESVEKTSFELAIFQSNINGSMQMLSKAGSSFSFAALGDLPTHQGTVEII